MKRTTVLALMMAGAAWAGEPWKLTLDANLMVGLVTYSEHWTGGEQGTFTWSTAWAGTAEKQFNPTLNSKTVLRLAFGQTKTKTAGEGHSWSSPKKSTDLIDLESVLKMTLKAVDPFVSVHGVSQFLDVSDVTRPYYYPYVNPVTITEALGVGKNIVEKDAVTWLARLGVAARQHIDRFDAETNSYETVTTADGGLELTSKLTVALRRDVVKYSTKLVVYEALLHADQGNISNDWRYPDINWEHTVGVSLTKYIMINYYLQFLYDRDVESNLRARQNLSVGLAYSGKLPKDKPKEAAAPAEASAEEQAPAVVEEAPAEPAGE